MPASSLVLGEEWPGSCMSEEKDRAWTEATGPDTRPEAVRDVHVRTLAEVRTPAGCVIRNMYLGDLRILRCYEGAFRLEVDGAAHPIELKADDMLVIYAGHRVSVWALEAANRLVYGVFTGRGAEPYADSLGFYDLAQGRTAPQYESLSEVKRRLEANAAENAAEPEPYLAFLTDILRTMARDLRANGNGLVFDAIGLMRTNLANRIVRLEPLCRGLGVSRSCLHAAFLKAGLDTPAEFIRKEQTRLAVSLLRHTRLSVAEVAERAGFISVAHFSTFIKTRTGRSPHQFRGRQNDNS